MVAIDTQSNKLIATIPVGQAPQALTYVPNAVQEAAGTENLQQLGLAGQTDHLMLVPVQHSGTNTAGVSPTSVSLFSQGLVQVLQSAVTGLEPKHHYVLALSENPDGSGALQPLAAFMTNPAGTAIVNSLGQIRQIVQGGDTGKRRYLVIAPQVDSKPGMPSRCKPCKLARAALLTAMMSRAPAKIYRASYPCTI